MCGIAGLILPKNRTIDPSLLERFSEKQKHRGPDDFGYLGWRIGQGLPKISRNADEVSQDAHIGFVHRRLTIIDKSEGGWQPKSSACGQYAICFNGEIYNFLELKKDLISLGVKFSSHSDTEVLLNALIHWGLEETLPRLIGMFAFAFLDCQAQKVVLARDPFGIKPLSYSTYLGGIAFASELTALLALDGVKRTAKEQAIYNYLRFGMSDIGSETLFASIEHLPPAHYAIVGLENLDVRPVRYWKPNIQTTADISFDEAATYLRDLFEKSVSLHMRSDVPLGATLSGGVDSSAVVKTMSNIKDDGSDLHTFSFVAPGEALDEERWANMVGESVNAKMYKVQTNGAELVRDLDTLIERQGEPFGTTSIYAQYRVFGLAREKGVPVTLDGQGADEILAGYMPFLAARLATMMKKGEFVRAQKFLSNVVVSYGSKAPVILRAMRFILPQVLQRFGRNLVGEKLVPNWMNTGWLKKNDVSLSIMDKNVDGDVLRHELEESLVRSVLPALLRYQDRNSMAYSIESRVPFLTTEIVNFLYSLPEEFLISDEGETKAVFRKAMRGIVPNPILDRRDKIGFATPEETWIGDVKDWVENVLESERINDMFFFDRQAFQSEIDAVRQGRKALTGEVWRWVNLIRWADTFDVGFE